MNDVITFHLRNIVNKRALLVCREDLDAVLGTVNQMIGERLVDLQLDIPPSTPMFVVFNHIAKGMKAMEAELQNFLVENYSSHLVSSINFSPPTSISIVLDVDDWSEQRLSVALH